MTDRSQAEATWLILPLPNSRMRPQIYQLVCQLSMEPDLHGHHVDRSRPLTPYNVPSRKITPDIIERIDLYAVLIIWIPTVYALAKTDTVAALPRFFQDLLVLWNLYTVIDFCSSCAAPDDCNYPNQIHSSSSASPDMYAVSPPTYCTSIHSSSFILKNVSQKSMLVSFALRV